MISWPELRFPAINLWNVWPSKEMIEPKDKVDTTNYKGFTNYECEFYPCHSDITDRFNCLFCYCPLAWLECPGNYEVISFNGVKRKDCSKCKIPHNGYEKSWKIMQKWVKYPKPWEELNDRNNTKRHNNCKEWNGSSWL